MTATSRPERWLQHFRDEPGHRARFIVFPHAGGGPSFYRKMALRLPPHLDPWVVQYPARESRLNDAPITDMTELADQIAEVVRERVEPPYVVFGHSLGASVAYETALRLGDAVTHGILSARKVPARPHQASVSELPSEELLAQLTGLGAIPSGLLDNPEMRDLVLPAIRGDYRIVETYLRTDVVRLGCGLTVLGGIDDPTLTPEDLAEWERYTAASARVVLYPGGHFYFNDDLGPVIDEIDRVTSALTRPDSSPPAPPATTATAPATATGPSSPSAAMAAPTSTRPRSADRAALAARLRRSGRKVDHPAAVSTTTPVRATGYQQSLWFLEQLAPGDTRHNMGIFLRPPGFVGADRLQRSIDWVVDRHPALRTSFATIDGKPHQIVAPTLAVPVETLDADGLDPEQRENAFSAWLDQPFDLTAPPLLRVGYWPQTDDDPIIGLAIHHIAADGGSLGIMLADIARTLDLPEGATGADALGPRPRLSYTDFSVWQRKRLDGGLGEQQLSYWRERLDPGRERLRLPGRGAVHTDADTAAGVGASMAVDGAVVAKIRESARRNRTTPFAVVLASWQMILHRATDQTDLPVGTAIDLRMRADLSQTVGHFVNTVVLGSAIDPAATFDDTVRATAHTVTEAHKNADVPFDSVVAEIAPGQESDGSPLFDAGLFWEPAAIQGAEHGWRAVPVSADAAPFVEAIAFWMDGDDEAEMVVALDGALYREETARNLARGWHTLLTNALDHPETPIAELEVVPAEHDAAPAAIGTGIDGSGPAAVDGLSTLVQAVDAIDPDRTAMRIGGTSISYRQLIEESEQVRSQLAELSIQLERNVAPDQVIVVDEGAGVGAIPVLLGALRAGRAVATNPALAVPFGDDPPTLGPRQVPISTRSRPEAAPTGPIWVQSDGGWLTHRRLAEVLQAVIADASTRGVDLGGTVAAPGRWLRPLQLAPLVAGGHLVERGGAESDAAGYGRGGDDRLDAVIGPRAHLGADGRTDHPRLALGPTVGSGDGANPIAGYHLPDDGTSLIVADRAGRIALAPGEPGRLIVVDDHGRRRLAGVPGRLHRIEFTESDHAAPIGLSATAHVDGELRWCPEPDRPFLDDRPIDLDALRRLVVEACSDAEIEIVGQPPTGQLLATTSAGAADGEDLLIEAVATGLRAIGAGGAPFTTAVRLASGICVNAATLERWSAQARTLATGDDPFVMIARAPDEGWSLLGSGPAASAEVAMPADDPPQVAAAAVANERSAIDPASEPAILRGPAIEGEATLLPLAVLEHGRRRPEAVAAVDRGASVTYGRLLIRTARMMAALAEAGVGRGSTVAIEAPYALSTIASICATWLMGACYVPLDPQHPVRRRQTIVEQMQPVVIVADDPSSRPPNTPDGGVVVGPSEVQSSAEVVADLPAALTVIDGGSIVGGDDVAYVIHTSGSTGGPKGVAVDHAGLANAAHVVAPVFRFGPDTVMPWIAASSFDISIVEMFGPLASGGQVLVVPPEVVYHPEQLAELMIRHRATAVETTPSLWRTLIDLPASDVPPIRVTGGEALPHAVARELASWPGRAVNMYGSTEAWWATFTTIDPEDRRVPIGVPLPGTDAFVLDDDLRPVARGEAGELYLASPYLARGYMGRPALTATRFIACPFGPPGSRMYRTGDLARIDHDGQIVCLGRVDHQVKLRGRRIELGEIEETLEAHPEVARAVVDTTPEGDALIAHLMPTGTARSRAERHRAATAAASEGSAPLDDLDGGAVPGDEHREWSALLQTAPGVVVAERALDALADLDDLDTLLRRLDAEAGSEGVIVLTDVLDGRTNELRHASAALVAVADGATTHLPDARRRTLAEGRFSIGPERLAVAAARFGRSVEASVRPDDRRIGWFRYDATLRPDGRRQPAAGPGVRSLPWRSVWEDTATLIADLIAATAVGPVGADGAAGDEAPRSATNGSIDANGALGSIEAVRIVGVPDARLGSALAAARCAADGRGLDVARSTLLEAPAPGLSPAELAEVAAALGWHLRLTLAEPGTLIADYFVDRPPAPNLTVPAADGDRERPLGTNPALVTWANDVAPRLRSHMSDLLPRYMVPAEFTAVEHLPLSVSGKVHRGRLARSLPHPDPLPHSTSTPNNQAPPDDQVSPDHQARPHGQAPPDDHRAPGHERPPDADADGDQASFAELFRRMVDRHPDADAVVEGERVLSYRTLSAEADRMAGALAARGIEIGEVVAVAVPRSADLIITLLAVLRAGAGYLVLDRSQPEARVASMIDDARPRWLVTDRSEGGPHPSGGMVAIDVADLRAAPHDRADDGAVPPPLAAIDPAGPGYLVYTSGSTGRPKGVLTSQRGFAALAADQRRHHPVLGPGARTLQLAAIGWDALHWEMSQSLLCGGCLVVVDDDRRRPGPDLLDTLVDERITHLFAPPSLLAVLPTDNRIDPTMTITAGGEHLPEAVAERWSRAVRLYNIYGPTEATAVSTHSARLTEGGPSPIGGASFASLTAHVLDERLRPVAEGEVGELYLSGVGLAAGYLRQPALTARRFIACPFGAPGARMYRTGDLVRREGADLHFVSRVDDQVKIRGTRIEPAEVETVLGECPGVEQVVVVATGPPDARTLVAYVAGTATSEQITAFARDRLLPAMVPSAVHLLPSIPLNTNGKADRTALRARAAADGAGAAGATTETTAEGSAMGDVVVLVNDGGDHERLRAALAATEFLDARGNVVEVDLRAVPDLGTLPPIRGGSADDGGTDDGGAVGWEAAVARSVPVTVGRPDRSAPDQAALCDDLRRIWAEVMELDPASVGDEDDFFDLGGHSLQAAEVVFRLQAEGHQVAVSDLMLNPTVGALATLLADTDRTLSDHQLGRATTVDPPFEFGGEPVAPERVRAPEHVLVTGATGYVGARMVRELLAETDATVECLVRPDPDRSPEQRLVEAVERFGPLPDGAAERLRTVTGDLRRDRLGLDAPDYERLARSCDHIVHLGADVNVLGGFLRMAPTNLDGTAHVMRLAGAGGRLTPVHHVSTLGVPMGLAPENGVGTNDRFFLDEEVEIPAAAVETGYVMTKWGGERVALQAREAGLPVNIFRLPRVGPDSVTGVPNTEDVMWRTMSAGVRIGAVTDHPTSPYLDEPLDLAPVDFVCAAIRWLATRITGRGTTYHVVNDGNPPLAAFNDRLRARGYPLRPVSVEEWIDELQSYRRRHSDLGEVADMTDAALTAAAVQTMADLVPRLSRIEVGTANLLAGLEGSGLSFPELDERLIDRFIDGLIASDLLPHPPGGRP
ncbi:MAG: amino acid adenylation domain-containing protein [Actinomycetota bacterium]